MIIPKRFYLEVHHPHLGDKAHFVVRYVPAKISDQISPFTNHCALMTNLYVAPKYRHDGVGTELLRMLKWWQDTTGTDIVFVVSPYAHKKECLDIWALKNFYSAHEFQEIKGTEYHYRKAKRRTSHEKQNP